MLLNRRAVKDEYLAEKKQEPNALFTGLLFTASSILQHAIYACLYISSPVSGLLPGCLCLGILWASEDQLLRGVSATAADDDILQAGHQLPGGACC